MADICRVCGAEVRCQECGAEDNAVQTTSTLLEVERITRMSWHAQRRWEDPLPVPDWVYEMKGVLGDAVVCDCVQCAGSDEREERYRRRG